MFTDPKRHLLWCGHALHLTEVSTVPAEEVDGCEDWCRQSLFVFPVGLSGLQYKNYLYLLPKQHREKVRNYGFLHSVMRSNSPFRNGAMASQLIFKVSRLKALHFDNEIDLAG